MSSICWYFIVAVIGVGIAAFTLYKKKNISIFIAFYLFAASITFLGEYFALAIFNGYAYKPGVFMDYFKENILGHLILNTTLYPGIAILIVAFSLSYSRIFLISVAFVLIEVLFVKLQIYEQHWWRYYMTDIAIFLYGIIVKKWFTKLNQHMNGFPRYITFYFIFELIIHSPFVFLLLSRKIYFSFGWDENIYRDSTLLSVIYHSFLSFICVFFVCFLQKSFWKMVPILIFLLSDLILIRMNILVIQDGWNFFYLALIRTICLVTCILLEKYTLKTPINRCQLV